MANSNSNARTRANPRAYRAPSFQLVQNPSRGRSGAASRGQRRREIATITATNESAFNEKQIASFVAASKRPASAGPTTTAVLTTSGTSPPPEGIANRKTAPQPQRESDEMPHLEPVKSSERGEHERLREQ